MEMLIRDARDEEQDFINELKLNAYEEHAHKIQEGHWTVLRNWFFLMLNCRKM